MHFEHITNFDVADFYVMELMQYFSKYEGWNFNSGNYLFTTDTK